MTWLAKGRRAATAGAWLASGLWALLAAVATAELLLTGGVDVDDAMLIALREWLPWVFLTPAVVWLARRFPLERGRRRLAVPVHLLACVAVVVLSGLWKPPPPGRRQAARGPASFSPSPSPGDSAGPWSPAGPRDDPFRGGPPRLFPEGPRMPGFFLMEIQRTRMEVPIYCLIVSLVHVLSYYRRSQERERRAAELAASLAEARLQALRTQLQPHFLFNALNAVSALMHKDLPAADDMLAELSELLRISLAGAAGFEMPLSRELEALACYLRIERRRFGARLEVSQEIEPGAELGYVPSLVLQPLAENAVRHGVGRTGRPVRLEIIVRRRGEELELRVQDDGPGLQGGFRDGIGLANTRARLRELYGPAASLRIENRDGGGCLACVLLPFHTAPMTISARP